MAEQELTYGQIAVGLTFNPSGDEAVTKAKQGVADIIDLLHDLQGTASQLQAAEIDEAIDQLKTAQMWAVKAITRKA